MFWKIEQSKIRIIESIIDNWMFDCKYSLNNEYFIICNHRSVQIFDAKTKELKHTNIYNDNVVWNVVFSPDGQMFATCSNDGSIVIYSLQNFSILSVKKNNYSTYCICFSPCSSYIYSGDSSGTIKKWDMNSPIFVWKSKLHSDWVLKVKFSMDGNYFLSGGKDGDVKLINSNNFAVIQTFGQGGVVRAIDFHPTKRIVVVGDLSKRVKFWNMDNGSLLHTINAGGSVFALHFLTPTILLIMSGDGYVTSYNVDSFQKIQKVYCGCPEDFFAFDISPDKKELVCGRCPNNSIRIFTIISSPH
eukprot:TRINITY_DN3030_c4_g16_i1.p1 TRINITY_DN3030_c4_g16~~TRINITY_DN3030_c4_g16_i1.p1  ORF type:complete len:302 (-),score=59.41 TRINITY_DN3030_c4_g16_i1:178-1083(-)